MEPNARLLLDPGPIDGSILSLQAEHRSTVIWEGQDPGTFHCRRSDAILKRPPLDMRVQRYLVQAGFYGIYRVGYIQLDWALITALVERWRVETHTFHLPVGECSITLQDVAVLLGAPVDGDPVTGCDASPALTACQELCQELLGTAPAPSDLNGSRLKLTWLAERFTDLAEDADDEAVRRHARAYILQLIGGSLFADKSGNMVKLMYLSLLRDLEVTGRFSWGSAILACLYRNMCRATKPRAVDISGPLIVLQLWAWERLAHIQPDRATMLQWILRMLQLRSHYPRTLQERCHYPRMLQPRCHYPSYH
uniref:Aminotransferase-like plant mobile domain-containing protein n=1 Tax=Davidia involucrata TaxID=16924 RepID=A0A5B6ZKM0_DAVIN